MDGPRAWQSLAMAAESAPVINGKAKSVIYLYMNWRDEPSGHVRPQAGTEVGGETKAAKSKVPGMAISDKFEQFLNDRQTGDRSIFDNNDWCA